MSARCLGLACLVASLATGCDAPRNADVPSQRRLVLLVTVDTLRPDYLSSSGYDRPTSPFLDSLFARGLVFRRAITPIARTTPALASLLTGAYPSRHGVRRLLDSLGPDVPTLATLARARGYTTIAVVSNHIMTPKRGLGAGFDVYDYATDARTAPETTRAAIGWLAGVEPGEPLFVWVHYIDPHVPYYPPRDLAEEFDPDYRGRYRFHFGSQQGGTGARAYPPDLTKVEAVFRNRLPAAVNDHIRRLYAADIRHTDDAIAELVAASEARFGKDWVILFTADHGEALGEKDFYYDHGDYVTNGEIRVPLAIVLPDSDPLHRAGVVDDWVSLIDVTPTLIELLALEPAPAPMAMDGRSLVPYLRGESLPARPVFAESGKSFFEDFVSRRVTFDVQGRFRAVIDGDWKLVFTPGQSPELRYELYDLASDPHEQENLHPAGHPASGPLAKTLESQLAREATEGRGARTP